MAVANADLERMYLSANKPEADTGTSGGARDANTQLLDRTNAVDMNGGAGEKVKLTSDSAADTQNCTLAGYGTDGAWLTETFALTGVTLKTSANTYKHLCKIALASDAIGTVTVAGNTTAATIHTIPIGERGAQVLFIKAEANAAGGAAKSFYEKVFAGNSHATDALISGKVWLSEDEDTELTMALEMSADVIVTNGSETTAARTTAPTTGGTYSYSEAATEGASLAVGDAADGNLVAAEYQGIWVKLSLAAGRTPEQVVQAALTLKGSAS
jgi:hypothetical protein